MNGADCVLQCVGPDYFEQNKGCFIQSAFQPGSVVMTNDFVRLNNLCEGREVLPGAGRNPFCYGQDLPCMCFCSGLLESLVDLKDVSYMLFNQGKVSAVVVQDKIRFSLTA